MPHLTPADLRLPPRAQVFLACDTGTHMSALFVAITSDHWAVVLEEIPNYRYISDQIDLLDLSNPEWAAQVVARAAHYQIRPHAWADPNTQFRAELRRYGLKLRPNTNGPELRVSVAREYVNHGRLLLAPWLRILPYELEHAEWQNEAQSSQKFERLKRQDHTLVCLEHILSRRPRPSARGKVKAAKRWIDRYLLDRGAQAPHTVPDPHLGDQ